MNVAITVLAFSAVLGEVFAAVGLSTLMPVLFVELCRLIRASGAAALSSPELLDAVLKLLPPLPGLPARPESGTGDADYKKALQHLIDSVKNLDKAQIQLLVPNSAHIDATFACSGTDSMKASASGGGSFDVATVNAGFSELFEIKSSCSVSLKVDFAPVVYTL